MKKIHTPQRYTSFHVQADVLIHGCPVLEAQF